MDHAHRVAIALIKPWSRVRDSGQQAIRTTRFFATLFRGGCTNTCRVHTPFLSVLFPDYHSHCNPTCPSRRLLLSHLFCCTGSEMLCFPPPIPPPHVLHVLTCEAFVSTDEYISLIFMLVPLEYRCRDRARNSPVPTIYSYYANTVKRNTDCCSLRFLPDCSGHPGHKYTQMA